LKELKKKERKVKKKESTNGAKLQDKFKRKKERKNEGTIMRRCVVWISF
jgi:hypothetical protein